MRDYLTDSNLVRSAGLSAVLTLMSAGRLLQGDLPFIEYVILTFLVMILISGAVWAWGRSAGMPGIVTDRQTLVTGVAIAVVVSLVMLPIRICWLDRLAHRLLQGAGNQAFVELSYPSSWSGRLALVLWSAGFQVMFLQAAPMSLFTRVTGRPVVAAGLCIALRAYVVYRQMAEAGIMEGAWLFMVPATAGVAVGCFLFARYGLVPAMLFAGGTDLHVFVGTLGDTL